MKIICWSYHEGNCYFDSDGGKYFNTALTVDVVFALSFFSNTQWASHSQLRSTWAGLWVELTAWLGQNLLNRLHPQRRWPLLRRPPPPPALRAPPLPPRDLRPRLTARTVANLYVPGRTTASTCLSTPVRHALLIVCLLLWTLSLRVDTFQNTARLIYQPALSVTIDKMMKDPHQKYLPKQSA